VDSVIKNETPSHFLFFFFVPQPITHTSYKNARTK
jgi:hypothetical protein